MALSSAHSQSTTLQPKCTSTRNHTRIRVRVSVQRTPRHKSCQHQKAGATAVPHMHGACCGARRQASMYATGLACSDRASTRAAHTIPSSPPSLPHRASAFYRPRLPVADRLAGRPPQRGAGRPHVGGQASTQGCGRGVPHACEAAAAAAAAIAARRSPCCCCCRCSWALRRGRATGTTAGWSRPARRPRTAQCTSRCS